MPAINPLRKDEIVKCARNSEYFIDTYCKIQHPIKGRIPFALFPFQRDCLRHFNENQLNIVLKSRQLGLSTVSAAHSIHDCMFHRNRKILVLATKESVAINLVKKMKFMLQNLPPWLVISPYESTRTQIRFENGSEIVASTTSSDAGRSEALSLLIVDEAAFIENFETVWTGVYPTLSTGGRAILLSSPNGMAGTGGLFFKIWSEAESGANDFHPIRLPWTVHPEHDREWFEKQKKNLGSAKLVAQELCCDFVSSGDTFLTAETLAEIRECITAPKKKEGWDNNVWVWDDPIPGHEYVITSDTSRGDQGGDFSTIEIMSLNDQSLVAEYKGKADPDRLADMLKEYGERYNMALLCPENNTYGFMTASRLMKLGYAKLFYEQRFMTKDQYGNDVVKPDAVAGWNTNVKTRAPMLSRLETVLKNGKLMVRSQRLYDELLTFVWNNNRAAAAKDSHDDLVLAAAIISTFIPDDASEVRKVADISMEMAMLKANTVVRVEPKQISIMGESMMGNRSLSGNRGRFMNPRANTYRGIDLRGFW